MKCLKIGNFYTKTIFILQAESLLADFAAAVKPASRRPGVEELYDFHQGWLSGTIDRDNRKYHLRLGREIDSNYWVFILRDKVLCFESLFSRLSFDLVYPARGPGGYFIKIYAEATDSAAFALSLYADSSFASEIKMTDKNLHIAVELKDLGDFLDCYYELNLSNDC